MPYSGDPGNIGTVYTGGATLATHTLQASTTENRPSVKYEVVVGARDLSGPPPCPWLDFVRFDFQLIGAQTKVSKTKIFGLQTWVYEKLTKPGEGLYPLDMYEGKTTMTKDFKEAFYKWTTFFGYPTSD